MPRRRQAWEPKTLAVLQGPRLNLRQPRSTDADAVYAYASDARVTRFMAWPRHTRLADSEHFLSLTADGWQKGNYLVWLIEDEHGVAGAIGVELNKVNAGIGYVLARESWGHGYATEALGLVSDALLGDSPVEAIWALCVTENNASRRVLEKSGFEYIRKYADYFACPNLGDTFQDVWLYRKGR